MINGDDNMRRRLRVGRFISLILAILLIIIAVYYFFTYNKDKNSGGNDMLVSLGFKDDEISKIENKFSKDDIIKLVSLNDKDIIDKLINSYYFNNEKLDNYISFYNKNPDINIDNIIRIVNIGVDTIDGIEYDDIIINLLDEKYFILDNIVRYINYFKNNSSLSSSEIITAVNSNLDYEFYTNTKGVDLSKGNLILVNKFFYLDKDYEPDDLVYIDEPYSYRGGYLKADVYEAFKKMVDGASRDNIELYSVSPYRSYETQDGLYEGYASYDGYDNADTYSARPGFSEHQTGLAVDINSTDDSFAYTPEAKWLYENAYKYGFILRYPKDKEYITGYQYEPWHYRYVGLEVAKKIYDEDITFEEYYAYYID